MARDHMSLRPRRSSPSEVHRIHQGAVLTAADARRSVALNPTAMALWELCDGHTSVQEMVDAVCALFGIDQERAGVDVSSALAQMWSAGVIV